MSIGESMQSSTEAQLSEVQPLIDSSGSAAAAYPDEKHENPLANAVDNKNHEKKTSKAKNQNKSYYPAASAHVSSRSADAVTPDVKTPPISPKNNIHIEITSIPPRPDGVEAAPKGGPAVRAEVVSTKKGDTSLYTLIKNHVSRLPLVQKNKIKISKTDEKEKSSKDISPKAQREKEINSIYERVMSLLNQRFQGIAQVGQTIENEDSFFNTMDQLLQKAEIEIPEKPNPSPDEKQEALVLSTNKKLRLLCDSYLQEAIKSKSDYWLKARLEERKMGYAVYKNNLKFTTKELNVGDEKRVAIPGRYDIEGRIFCGLFNIQLHVIVVSVPRDELGELDDTKDIDLSHKLVTADYCLNRNEIDMKDKYNEPRILHMVVFEDSPQIIPIINLKLTKREVELKAQQDLIMAENALDDQKRMMKETEALNEARKQSRSQNIRHWVEKYFQIAQQCIDLCVTVDTSGNETVNPHQAEKFAVVLGAPIQKDIQANGEEVYYLNLNHGVLDNTTGFWATIKNCINAFEKSQKDLNRSITILEAVDRDRLIGKLELAIQDYKKNDSRKLKEHITRLSDGLDRTHFSQEDIERRFVKSVWQYYSNRFAAVEKNWKRSTILRDFNNNRSLVKFKENVEALAKSSSKKSEDSQSAIQRIREPFIVKIDQAANIYCEQSRKWLSSNPAENVFTPKGDDEKIYRNLIADEIKAIFFQGNSSFVGNIINQAEIYEPVHGNGLLHFAMKKYNAVKSQPAKDLVYKLIEMLYERGAHPYVKNFHEQAVYAFAGMERLTNEDHWRIIKLQIKFTPTISETERDAKKAFLLYCEETIKIKASKLKRLFINERIKFIERLETMQELTNFLYDAQSNLHDAALTNGIVGLRKTISRGDNSSLVKIIDKQVIGPMNSGDSFQLMYMVEKSLSQLADENIALKAALKASIDHQAVVERKTSADIKALEEKVKKAENDKKAAEDASNQKQAADAKQAKLDSEAAENRLKAAVKAAEDRLKAEQAVYVTQVKAEAKAEVEAVENRLKAEAKAAENRFNARIDAMFKQFADRERLSLSPQSNSFTSSEVQAPNNAPDSKVSAARFSPTLFGEAAGNAASGSGITLTNLPSKVVPNL